MPQLEVPKVTPFASEMGNNYIRERPLEEIVERMMKPADAGDDSEKEEESAPAASHPSVNAS